MQNFARLRNLDRIKIHFAAAIRPPENASQGLAYLAHPDNYSQFWLQCPSDCFFT
jgi:hypothetical protein